MQNHENVRRTRDRSAERAGVGVGRVCQVRRSLSRARSDGARDRAQPPGRRGRRRCARRPAAGVHDGRVVAPAEALRRWRGGSRRCARGRGTSRPGAARRGARCARWTAARRGVTSKASQASSWMRAIGRAARPVPGRRGRVEAGEDLVGQRGVDRSAGERVVGDDADQRALERARVGGDAVGDDVQRAVVGELDAVVLDALAQDRHARGEVGWRDVGDEAGLEALAQAVLERGEVGGQAVGGEDELAAGLVQRVEGVEELLLGLRLALEELDVVDEQDVGVAEARLEALDVARLQRRDELVREALGGRGADAQPAAVGAT